MKNKVRYIGGIISNSSAVDQQSQSLSVFNVIDEITVDMKAINPAKPLPQTSTAQINVPIRFQVISLWKRNNLSDQSKELNFKLEVEMIDPLGKSLAKNIIDSKIPADKKRNRYILTINGMPVTVTGEYLIQFREVNGNETSEPLTSFILDIVVNKS